MHLLNIETVCSEFDDLIIENNILDAIYCRWALAWISNPKHILQKLHTSLKVGGKLVLHEYYDWTTHQMSPYKPALQHVINQCHQSFEDAPGNISIGKELPEILDTLGYKVTSIRQMNKLVRPNNFSWFWPISFLRSIFP